MDFIVLGFFLFPLFAIIFFNSTLYGGWRHLYFIYPGLIYFVSVGINYLFNIKNKKKYKFIFFASLIFALINNLFIFIKFHPYQISFNSLIKKKLINFLKLIIGDWEM